MPPRSTSRREFLQATVVAGTLAGVPDLHAAGKILLQCEGFELFVREFELHPLKK